MRKLKVRTLAVPLFILGVTMTFQNCDAGFHYDPSSGELSSLSANNQLTGSFGVAAYDSLGVSAISASTTLTQGQTYLVEALGSQTGSALLTWSIDQSSTASCVLTPVGNLTQRDLNCSTSGTVIVDLQAVWPEGEISSVSMTHTVSAVVATPTPSQIPSTDTVTFHIAAGTSGSPWNTAATAIEVYIGQTLVLYNDDSTVHRIHAAGMPFIHQPDDTPVGGTRALPVTATHSGTATDLYDHDKSTSAVIYIASYDGAAEYRNSCASCHGGDPASSQKRGASFSSIKNAISSQSAMRGITLSDAEIRSIAYVLNK